MGGTSNAPAGLDSASSHLEATMLPVGPVLRRRTVLGLAMIAALAASAPAPVRAQSDYPSRPITLIVPFPAGGQSDLVARLVTSKMIPKLGQQIVVENRGGAGGNIAAGAAAKAEPDGYTLFLGFVGTHGMNSALYKKLPYDPVKDFAPISLLNITPLVLVVHPDFPARSVQELIDLAKADPGKYSYASSGNGTPLHLSAELLKLMAGIDLVHVPYKGAAPALIDVIGGHVPLMFDNLPPSLEHIRSGKLRALGVTTKDRASSVPELPTIAETVPGYETYSWNALFAPAGTPRPIIDRLNAAALAALADPEVTAKLKELSIESVGSTPEELAAHVQAELAKWGPVVRSTGAQL
jgi:tripartite-type tricarboxylate transporter receptor subunit TctC